MSLQQLIVHSHLVNGNELLHNIQCDNQARLKHTRRLLLHLGSEARAAIRTVDTPEGEYHTIDFWSLEDRLYHTIPRRPHNAILKALKLRVNNVHVTPTVLSTYAQVGHSRTSRRRSPSSPVPLRRWD